MPTFNRESRRRYFVRLAGQQEGKDRSKSRKRTMKQKLRDFEEKKQRIESEIEKERGRFII